MALFSHVDGHPAAAKRMRFPRLIRSLPVLITVILFFVPFFWLKPGEMDLGGDSSRLFFYDPLSYLRSHMLYSVIPSGIGGDALSYYAIPYMLFLAFLRWFFSPTTVISIVNGIKLSGAFLFSYLVIHEIINGDKREGYAYGRIASVFAGLFYVFSPILVHSGWDRAMLSHVQIFLNPLFAYLLLRYFVTHRRVYIVVFLLLSFVFSFNFSFLSAPGFFAFFPFTVLFLCLYVSLIQRKRLPWKGLLTGALLFLGVQSFHIIPHAMSLLFGKSQYTAVFSDVGRYTRGLDYFVAIAPSIKVSISLLGLAQLRDLSPASVFHFVFPVSVVLAFLFYAKRTLTLVALFYLATLFFVSASISETGFALYKFMFHIPGFKMFRNFFAQWSMVYVFFYALLLGVAWRTVFAVLNRRISAVIGIISLLALTRSALPLLRGDLVRAFHFESLRVPQVFRMDPLFEKALTTTKNLPVDGKILSFPLPGPGYQVVAGKDGGAYIGPSFFSYLTGKNDFTGYDGLDPFGDAFLDSIFRKDIQKTERLFSLLNVRYIFYNSDPAIYEAGFPGYPYNYVRDFLPATQKEYRELLAQFPLKQDGGADSGEYYHILPVQERVYLPHIYATTTTTYATYPESVIIDGKLGFDERPAVYHMKDGPVAPSSRLILEADAQSPFRLLTDNFHLHRHEPFISRQLDDPVYPLTIVKERFELWRVRKDRKRWIDFQLYYLTKRILELTRWGELLPTKGSQIQAPRLFTFWDLARYNNWEASLVRYEQTMRSFIRRLDAPRASKSRILADTIKVREQLDQHRVLLTKFLNTSHRSDTELAYLRRLTDEMFDRLVQDVRLPVFSEEQTEYSLELPEGLEGKFDVLVENERESKNIDIARPGVIPFVRPPSGDSRSRETVRWLSSGGVTTQNDVVIARLVDPAGDQTGGAVAGVENWQSGTQYLLTFEYRTGGRDVSFRAFEKQYAAKGSSVLRRHVFFEKLLRADEWKTHQSLLTSNIMTKEGYLQFMNDTQNGIGRIEIRNMRVTPVRYPKVFFTRKADVGKQGKIPRITFRKVNQSLYEMEVTDVRGPYTIVFLEKYDDAWRLVDPHTNADTVRGWIARMLASFISPVVERFSPVPAAVDVASYFDGNVREAEHKNSFLDPRNFLIRGKKTVSESSHRRVNGYANAWTVRPDDMDGQHSYTLFIEMRSQKYFYLFSGISLLFVVGLVIVLGREIVRHKRT